MLFLSGIPGHSLQEVALIAFLVNFDAFRTYLRLERVVLHALGEEHRPTVPNVPVRNGGDKCFQSRCEGESRLRFCALRSNEHIRP